MKVLLGLDIGTSGAKGVITDLQGRRLAEATGRYSTTTEGVGAEQDAEDWWRAIVSLVPGLIAGHEVLGLAVTSQAPTLVTVDGDGSPTGPALTWLDRRSEVEAKEIAEHVPESRNGADPFFGTAKLLWLDRHRSKIVTESAQVLSANGFITRRLSGCAVLDDSTASLMQGFDESVSDFPAELRRRVPALQLLPEILPSRDIVGQVSQNAATTLGLRQGTPVIAGGIDAVGAALEAGALTSGDPMVDMTGFSSVTVLPVPRGTRVPGLIHARHCLADTDLLITAQVTAGATIDWVNGLSAGVDLRSDAELSARSRPGRLVMVPSLAGERTPTWNAQARGIIDGIDLSTDGFDLMIAAMEGNALALADSLQTLAKHGFAAPRILSTGGGAASHTWMQIKADVLGMPIERPESGHGAAQGAAALAGLAVGVYSSVEDLRATVLPVEASYRPDPGRHAQYRSSMARYRRLAGLNRGTS